MSNGVKITIAVVIFLILIYWFFALDIPYRKDFDTLQNATSTETVITSTTTATSTR